MTNVIDTNKYECYSYIKVGKNMKYDLVSAIDDALRQYGDKEKNIRQLTEKQKELIRLIQNQVMPELDGLKFVSLDFSNDEDEHIIVKTTNRKDKKFNMGIYNSQVIIIGEDNSFSIFMTKNTDEPNYDYGCCYNYGDDIISIEREEQNHSSPIVHINIYINAADISTDQTDSSGVPITLIPDITGHYKAKGLINGYMFEISGPGNKDVEICEWHLNEMLTNWRKLCNKMADEYHMTRFEALEPKSMK